MEGGDGAVVGIEEQALALAVGGLAPTPVVEALGDVGGLVEPDSCLDAGVVRTADGHGASLPGARGGGVFCRRRPMVQGHPDQRVCKYPQLRPGGAHRGEKEAGGLVRCWYGQADPPGGLAIPALQPLDILLIVAHSSEEGGDMAIDAFAVLRVVP
ncbi:MAG: hypothetical protein CL812_12595 [Confluentimicrobium sp.]|nr:hypothetical protein [Actibacterium sp.]